MHHAPGEVKQSRRIVRQGQRTNGIIIIIIIINNWQARTEATSVQAQTRS
jgi:hypothetical protein